MAATVTLGTTVLAENVDAASTSIKVTSTSGLTPGLRLYLEGELMTVQRLNPNGVTVLRGQDGSASNAHSSGATMYVGRADQFYFTDPKGRPNSATLVSPYINVKTGVLWHAQGDTLPESTAARWWQPVATTYGVGALGVRTTSEDPTSST